ncbi:MAG: flagellin [Archaeoglobaceae archaeon]
MALRINFNFEGASTHTAILSNERAMNKSLLRLSTGMRILNAADDSAGLFIADQLMVVASGLEEGNRNILTALSALRIAESSAGQIFDRLNEIYRRTVRAANDINDPNARASLQREINNLIDAIQKIGTDTEYNGIKLLDGTFTNKYIHYGPRYGQMVDVRIGDVRAQSLGAHIVSGSGRVVTSGANQAISALQTHNDHFALADGEYLKVAGQTVLNGTTTTVLVDAATAARNINNDAKLQSMGIEAVAKNRSVAADFTGVVSGDAGATVKLHFYVGARAVGSPSFSITGITANTTLSELVTMINSQASASGVPLTARAENGRLVLETANGETIAIEAEVTQGNNVSVDFSQLIEGAGNVRGLDAGQRAYAIKVGELQIYGTESFVVNESGIDIVGNDGPDANITSTFNNLYSIDVSTNQNAERAMLIVKKALQRVDTIRAQIGAVMNNLQSIYDAQKVAWDNTKEAENVIRNTDYAEEMTNFIKLQIKMQASMAMLAQANQLPQLVLQLLR